MASHFKPPYFPTYQGADDYLNGKDSKRISANTQLVRISVNCIALRLYSTDIVQYRDNGMIIINTGGYWTNTTKRYINGASPAQVSTVKGELYIMNVQAGDGKGALPWDGGPYVAKKAD